MGYTLGEAAKATGKSKGTISKAIKEGRITAIKRKTNNKIVSFDVTRTFVERVKEHAPGIARLKSVKPGQQLVKIVHDELIQLLGGERQGLAFQNVGPTVVLLVGLQGSGKTTTAAKLAARCKRQQKAPFLVAADVYRPAAREQLEILGASIDVPVYGTDAEPDVVALVRAAVAEAESARARTVIVDTAGRSQIDDQMMGELKRLKEAVAPHEILLVADAMTGQDAVRIAQGFDDTLGITGVILTKLDGDARGGAALSIHGVTGAPIKFVGVGEKVDQFDEFDPVRMAGRILQQGDLVGLVERAEDALDEDQAKKLASKASSKRGMDLQDFLAAMRQMQQLGPLEGVLGMLPGMNRKSLQMLKGGDKKLKYAEAIVLSMTPEERAKPQLLNGSRRLRIAKGSGRPVSEINRLLKSFEEMRRMMKHPMMKGMLSKGMM